jgi:putative hydrolase of HD superfamily
MDGVFELLRTAEHLHYEKRACQMSDGEKQSVSSHMWMMSLMAIIFAPKLNTPVNMERVLKMIVAHDLAESETHDWQVHEQMKHADAAAVKHASEQAVMEKWGGELYGLWLEYEERKTREAMFVKALDKLDVDVQVACSKTLDYVGEYDDGVYWRIYFAKNRADPCRGEPALMDFFLAVRAVIERRMRDELGLNPDIYKV